MQCNRSMFLIFMIFPSLSPYHSLSLYDATLYRALTWAYWRLRLGGDNQILTVYSTRSRNGLRKTTREVYSRLWKLSGLCTDWKKKVFFFSLLATHLTTIRVLLHKDRTKIHAEQLLVNPNHAIPQRPPPSPQNSNPRPGPIPHPLLSPCRHLPNRNPYGRPRPPPTPRRRNPHLPPHQNLHSRHAQTNYLRRRNCPLASLRIHPPHPT